MTINRQKFLEEFLGALGAEKVAFSCILTDRILGTAIYDVLDSEARQDFCWHATEAELPSSDVYRLVALIHSKKLLDIDQLVMRREDLRTLFNDFYKVDVSLSELSVWLDLLESVEVSMVNDGKETDAYFIHE